MSRFAALSTLLVAIFCSCSASNADIILDYVPLESKTNPTLTASNVNPFVTADDMATGGGVSAYGNSVWRWRNWDPANTSFATALADGETWTWGYDIAGDVQVKLTSLQFRVDRNLAGPDDIEVQMSINGGTGVTVLSHDFAGNGAPVTFDVDLSPFAKFQKQFDSIEFTFAGFNATTTGGWLTLDPFGSGSGLVLNGTVSVPEPGSMCLIAGIAGIAVIGRRRKMKQKQAKKELQN